MSRDSFEQIEPGLGPNGQKAHPMHLEQSARLERTLYKVADRAWCFVGNGLSNQTFVETPGGLICIDTGECIEEMQAAMRAVRRHTNAPVIACIYTHFHYVNGTAVLEDECPSVDIYGHAGIAANLARYGGETGPRITRGIMHQFGVSLPAEGEDAIVNVGLGHFFRNPDHQPYTAGYLPVTHPVQHREQVAIGGLNVTFLHAPSDADDSITIWFPELGICINNLVWPALYNVFAVRGEAYRDPRVLLGGIDDIISLAPDHLIATHGPPLSGREEIDAVATDYRDSIQFLWDQTVRGANKGLGLDELTSFVTLPERFARTHFTQQFYGVAEHHVKQIYNGLFGWFDERPANLFPLSAPERARRMIEAMGGREAVRQQAEAAAAEGETRWAIELASYLVDCPAGMAEQVEDRQRLADLMRFVGQRTISANIRNWCLTRALELEGSIDLSRFRDHRFRAAELTSRPPAETVGLLRVMVAPEKTVGMNAELAFDFGELGSVGLRVRDGVALTSDGRGAETTVVVAWEVFAAILAGKTSLTSAVADGTVTLKGDRALISSVLAAFDHPAFADAGELS